MHILLKIPMAVSVFLLASMFIATSSFSLSAEDIEKAQTVTPPSNNEHTDATDESEIIESDNSLLVDSFFSHPLLMTRSYGLLVSVGGNSPHQQWSLEAMMLGFKNFSFLLSLGIAKKHKVEREEYSIVHSNMSAEVRARYHTTIIPLFFGIQSGYVSWEGEITPLKADNKQTNSFNAGEYFVGASVGAYYFWEIGIYVETTIFGISLNRGNQINFKNKDSSLQTQLEKKLNSPQLYGLFGRGLNLTVGYCF